MVGDNLSQTIYHQPMIIIIINIYIVQKKENVFFHTCACLMVVRYIKKEKCMNKLGIIFKNRKFHEKFFNSDADSNS